MKEWYVMQSKRRRSSRRVEGPFERRLRSIYGGRNPRDLFVSRANRIRLEHGIGGPPFSPYEYAAALNIEVRSTDDTVLDGMVKKDKNGKFIAELRNHPNRGRQNFTLAHEIAHTFFYEELLMHSERYRNQKEVGDVYDKEEERLCDIAAAELLMPFSVFKKDVVSHWENERITPRTILQLSNRYQVSLLAAAFRVWDTWKHKSVLWFREGTPIRSEWISPTWSGHLQLCRTGHSSTELAFERPGKLFESRDSFYQVEPDSRIRRRTISLGISADRVLSVLTPEKK